MNGILFKACDVGIINSKKDRFLSFKHPEKSDRGFIKLC